MAFLFGIAVGLALGWIIPQPAWFTDLLAKIKKDNP